MTATPPTERVRSRTLSQIALGARLALGSGREGWGRLLLTALGVGIGVALLLFTSSFPGIVQHRTDRLYVQEDTFVNSLPSRTAHSLLIARADTTFKGAPVRGRLVRPEGAEAPLPPGVAHYPAAGRMVVSPALAALLKAPGSGLLRERLPYPVVGTIGQAGLLGPAQLDFVLGSDRLSTSTGALRITGFGHFSPPRPMDPQLVMLNLVGLVVMLAPVGVFLAAAARFGGERRDRRLAALRLAGADRRMTARLAAGESLAGSMFGLLAGVALFLIGRQIIPQLSVAGFSFFARDISPQPLIAALVAVLVPAMSVGVTLVAMRRVTVEPLGVVRRSGREQRQLGWRLLLPLLGLGLVGLADALPGPSLDSGDGSHTVAFVLVAFGMLVMLLGLCTLLPWLVEAVSRRARGGGLSWQLAVRRLQLAPGPATAAVSGVVVAVAGAIALQSLFLSVSGGYDSLVPPAPGPGAAAGAAVTFPGDAARIGTDTAALARGTGVSSAIGYLDVDLTGGSSGSAFEVRARVADCATLRHFAVLPDCADGDVFMLADPSGTAAPYTPGTTVLVSGVGAVFDGGANHWKLPRVTGTAEAVPSGAPVGDPSAALPGGTLLATPGAVPASVLRGQDATVFATTVAGLADPEDQLTTDAMRISPQATVSFPSDPGLDQTYRAVKSLLTAGTALTLLLVALSLLVGQLERLREQRRLLGVLYAVGTRRRVLGLSVLWQTMLPMALGLALAAAGGLGMGAVLQHTSALPVSVDWGSMLTVCGFGAGAVLLGSLLTLPPLLRLMRPGALRSE